MNDTLRQAGEVLQRAGKKLQAARAAEQRAFESAKQAAIAAFECGAPEAEIARALGVDRMTVRKWLGKR